MPITAASAQLVRHPERCRGTWAVEGDLRATRTPRSLDYARDDGAASARASVTTPLRICRGVTPPYPSNSALGNRTSAQYAERDRKSTRLNSSHGYISYAVFCLK